MKYRQDEGAELPQVVREALSALRSVPEPAPEVWEGQRRAFLAQARAYAKEAVTSDQSVRRRGWKSIFTFSLKEATPMSIIARLVMMVVLALGGSIGTVQAARDSLPGSILYAVKVQLEQLETRLARTPTEATDRALAQAEARVEEAARLVDRGQPIPDEVVQRYAQHLGMALQASSQVEEPMRRQMQQRIEHSLQQQMQVMAQMTTRVQERNGDGDDQAIERMIQVMKQTQAQLCTAAGETCPGPNADSGAPAGDRGHHNQDGDTPNEQHKATPTPKPTDQMEPHKDGCTEDGHCEVTPTSTLMPTSTLSPTPKCTPMEQPKSHRDEGSMDGHHDVVPTPIPTATGIPANGGSNGQQDEGGMDNHQSQTPTPTPKSTPSDQGGGDMGGGDDGGQDGGSHNPGGGGGH